MTPITRPRGPLPARVYWTRRLLVLVVVLGTVFGIAQLLGGGGGGAGPSARPVAADPTSTPTPTTPTVTSSATVTSTDTPTATPTGTPTGPTPSVTGRPGAGSPTVLAAPSGTCENSDVVVVPSVASPAYAGRPVILSLSLTTKVTPACNWVVSDNLVLKVTSGEDRFWSTQDCDGAVPKQSVVVRSEAPTTVSMAWNGQRSDAECSRTTSWAEPGYYHVMAAAFGADPTDVQFRLFKPVRETITASPTPSPTAKATRTPRRR